MTPRWLLLQNEPRRLCKCVGCPSTCDLPGLQFLVEPLQVPHGQVIGGVRVTLVRRLLEPLHGLRVVLVHAFTCAGEREIARSQQSLVLARLPQEVMSMLWQMDNENPDGTCHIWEWHMHSNVARVAYNKGQRLHNVLRA